MNNEAYAQALHEMTAPPPSAAAFGYEGIEQAGRRKPIVPSTRSEDYELLPQPRRLLISGTRDLPRNFSIAAWAIRKHLDYVSTFKFKAKTDDAEVDDRLESMMQTYSQAGNCDVAGRHSLRRIVRMLEARRTVDGDVFLNLLNNGKLQVIEGDRVRTPEGGLPTGVDWTKVYQGVVTDDYGAATGYAVCDRARNGGGGLLFREMLDPKFCRQLGYFDRIDQTRGISPMAPAINSLRDVYEGFDMALAKSKVAQMFALAFYRNKADALGLTTPEDGDEDADEPRYKVDFNRGPLKLDLEPGDRAEFLESHTPSSEFQAFTAEMITVSLKSLDIPACFYDEGRANFSSGRQGWLLYDQSAKSKREDLRELLDYVTAWIFRVWFATGQLKLPKGMTVDDLHWEWIHAGIPWIDPTKEAVANAMEVNSGITSRQRICKERGEDYFTIVDELAEEADYAKEKGVTFTETPITVNVVTGDDTTKDNSNGN